MDLFRLGGNREATNWDLFDKNISYKNRKQKKKLKKICNKKSRCYIKKLTEKEKRFFNG